MSVRSHAPDRALLAAIASTLAGLLVPLVALATPMNFGTDAAGKPILARWPDNTTIHVYIPTPPKPPDSCATADAKAGIQRWAAALAQRGITIQFHENQAAPPGATNAVGIEWKPPGSIPGGNQGMGGVNAHDVPGGAVVDSGYVQAETDEPCGEGMRNLFMHEFGHALGLADEATDEGEPHNVMDHDVPEDTPMTFSPRDSAEMRSLYGCFALAPPSMPQGGLHYEITPVGSPPRFLYEYRVEWLAGPEIPTLDISLGGPRDGVSILSMPPGWQVAVPPFYLDAAPTPAVTEDTRELHFHTTEDGIGPAMPIGVFVLESAAPPVPGWGLTLVDPEEDGLFEPLPILVPGFDPTAVPAPGTPGRGLRWLPPRPNPFRDGTRLGFVAPAPWRSGRAEVFDLGGRLVRAIALGSGLAGENGFDWDGRTSAGAPAGAGAYFVRVTLDGASVLGTVVLAR